MKMNKKLLRLLLLCLCGALMLPLAGCDKGATNTDGITKLSFKSASSYEDLKALDGKTVAINGYMATSSPVDGGYIFLMNLPYQSCPFCVPNTSQLSNTMAVYAPKGEAFTYTTQAIKVVGKLVVAESESQPFTDNYGYEFSFKIVDATYTILKDEDLSADMALWQKVATSGVIDEIYRMYDYVNFLCAWNTYFVNSFVDASGAMVPGYYLYPTDAMRYLTTEGGQWNYGYKEGYFDDLAAKVKAIDPEAFTDLVSNIEKAKALAEKALLELESGNYTYEIQYVEKFGTEDKIYTLNKGEELKSEMNDLYKEFSLWLSGWEM